VVFVQTAPSDARQFACFLALYDRQTDEKKLIPHAKIASGCFSFYLYFFFMVATKDDK